MIINERRYNNNNAITYVYIAFSDDKKSCYEVDEKGNSFSPNLYKPDFDNCPHLLGYDNYYFKEMTEEGYYVYESKAYYVGTELIQPAQIVIFNEDYSRLNKQNYSVEYDSNYGFNYVKLMSTAIYEVSASPKKEKKSTPFY